MPCSKLGGAQAGLVASGWLYHPHEIIVRPVASDSQLARGLAVRLARANRVGLVRHGAAALARPAEPSGLNAARSGGVWGVMAANGQDCLFGREGHFDLPSQRTILSDADLVVVEANVDAGSPLVLELQPDGSGLEAISAAASAKLVAVVGARRPVGKLPSGGVAWFGLDDLDGLADHLLGWWEQVLKARPLWGLFLPNNSFDHPESQAALQILSGSCGRVFVAAQTLGDWARCGWELAPDRHSSWGDLDAVLSCLEAYPEASFLVLGGQNSGPDALSGELIGRLLSQRNALRMATVFREPNSHLPQRTPSIWEAKARMRIHLALAADIHCLQRILTHSHVQLLDRADSEL